MAIPSGLPLSALTALVERVRATSKKNEKVGLIADVLRQARGREAELLAMYLTGALAQGRIGLGWAAIHAALEGAPPPQGDPLALVDVDGAFEGLAAEGGAGSAERRTRALRALMARAREDERRFLAALVLGEVVLEGETTALRADGRPHPFQVTMRRFGRSKDVEAARRELPLSSFFFDCLYREGEGALIGLPYAQRAERLAGIVPERQRLPRLITRDPEDADRF